MLLCKEIKEDAFMFKAHRFINVFFSLVFYEYRRLEVPNFHVKIAEIAQFISGTLSPSIQQLQKHFSLDPHMVPRSGPAFVTS